MAAPSSSGYTLPACCSQTTQRGSGWQAWIEVCFLLYGAGPEVSGPSPSTFLIPLDWGHPTGRVAAFWWGHWRSTPCPWLMTPMLTPRPYREGRISMVVLKSPTCQKQEEERLEPSHLPGRTVAFQTAAKPPPPGPQGSWQHLKMPVQLSRTQCLENDCRIEDGGYTCCVRVC